MNERCYFAIVDTRGIPSPELYRNGRFKHVEGKNDTTAFLHSKIRKVELLELLNMVNS